MSSYDKRPAIKIKNVDKNSAWEGYANIINEIKEKIKEIDKATKVVSIDCYPGVRINELQHGLVDCLSPSLIVLTDEEVFQNSSEVTEKIGLMMTQDRVFGKMCLYNYEDFIIDEKLKSVRSRIKEAGGLVMLIGSAAGIVWDADIHIYADLPRQEVLNRYKSNEIANWKSTETDIEYLLKYKRGYFFEWRMADRYKAKRFHRFQYIIDTTTAGLPKMISGHAFEEGLKQAVTQPFRVVPFFDPSVWGGQWMKKTFGLDGSVENYGWCFDCVPEENSLLLEVGDVVIEIPSIDLVLKHSVELLGSKVYSRFGAEFPIRFDFLDTYDGQNLSLQVHPITQFAKETFGIQYTQDESYYILDAKEGASVFLGFKSGADKESFIRDLYRAQEENCRFPHENYINELPAKKHDHFLIPAGTVHCSGKNTVVLEISATPYIFTFKLWDWGRLGLDGKPRPIHINYGEEVLQYNRDTQWVMNNLVNRVTSVEEGDGCRCETTGLHELEFIETKRYWFSRAVNLNTKGSVNVLNLIEGEEAIVTSPSGSFEGYAVHYGETFIMPAEIGEYTISPYGTSEGREIAVIKASVRI
jgi:Phosphomannose isomerase